MSSYNIYSRRENRFYQYFSLLQIVVAIYGLNGLTNMHMIGRLLKSPYFLLKTVGLNPFDPKRFGFRSIILMVAQIVMAVLILMGLKDFRYVTADVWVSCIMALQGVIKGSSAILQKDAFYNIGEALNCFLSRKFTSSEQKIEEFVHRMQYTYTITLILALVAFIIKPAVVKQHILPSAWYDVCDIEATITCYLLCYGYQCYASAYCVIIITAFDCMFSGLLVYGYIEMEYIKRSLLQLNDNENCTGDNQEVLLNIGILVERHNQVLRYFRDIDKAYSGILMCQYAATLMIICSAIFCLTTSGNQPPVDVIVTSVSYFLAGITEIFFLCLSGDIISLQSESIVHAAYGCNWNHKPKLTKALCLMIIRSQRACRITVGGLWILNLETFTSVMKATMTLLTFMKKMYGR